MRSSHGPTAYPFFAEEQAIAGRFAAFLTDQVDPAEVVGFEQVGPDATVVWASPITELLNWYEKHGKAAAS